MTERPIVLRRHEVVGIIAGTQTQLRRVVKLKPHHEIEERNDGSLWPWMYDSERDADHWLLCPFGKPGDRLWVREAWANDFEHNRTYYRADADVDGTVPYLIEGSGAGIGSVLVARWRPSIHMPRWASRITLENAGVRVERLHDISEADAIAEGIGKYDNGTFGVDNPSACMGPNARVAYMRLWDHINGHGSWDANPWVWVVEFERSKEQQT